LKRNFREGRRRARIVREKGGEKDNNGKVRVGETATLERRKKKRALKGVVKEGGGDDKQAHTKGKK